MVRLTQKSKEIVNLIISTAFLFPDFYMTVFCCTNWLNVCIYFTGFLRYT